MDLKPTRVISCGLVSALQGGIPPSDQLWWHRYHWEPHAQGCFPTGAANPTHHTQGLGVTMVVG